MQDPVFTGLSEALLVSIGSTNNQHSCYPPLDPPPPPPFRNMGPPFSQWDKT